MSKAFTREDSDAEEPADDGELERLLANDAPRYITQAGFERLQQEFHEGSTVTRPTLARETAEATAAGERTESAEAVLRKKRLRDLDKRLRLLPHLLERLTVVPPIAREDGRAYFGARVTVEDDDGKRSTFRLVGPDELDAERGHVSADSPLGKALLGKREGDDVTVTRPRGVTEYVVVGVAYDA